MKTFIIALIGAVVCMATGDEICGSNPSLECVRNHFKKNGKCSVVSTANENPSYDVNLPIYLPKINLTVVTTKTYPKSLDGEIKVFRIDDETKNLVMSVNFKRLFCDAPGTVFCVSQNQKEPKCVSDYVNASYPTDTLLTASIPSADGITLASLEDAMISAYFENTDVALNIGPKFTESEDPDMAAAYNALLQNIPTAVHEIFRTKATFYFLIYLQNFICNFDAPPTLQDNYDMTVVNSILDKSYSDESMSRPCDQSEDIRKCVGDYLHKQGSCSVIEHPSEDPVQRDLFKAYVPWLNVTAATIQSSLTVDGTIKEFYINKESENVVISVDFPGIVLSSPIVPLIINQRGEAPKVIYDYIKNVYPCQLTAVIPMKNGITAKSIENAVVSAYFHNSNMKYEFGPKFTESSDPDVIAIVEGVHADPVTVTKELFVNEAHNMFLAYLQSKLCNYDIPLSMSP